MIKGNKGEWSEFYTFLKLLAEGKIYAADKDLNKNENIFYQILKIIRGKGKDYEYIRNEKIIIQEENGKILAEIPVSEALEISEKFYEGIAKGKTGERAFNLDFAGSILDKFHTQSLSDERKQTADIRIVIHDPITQYEPLLGFSIKSFIGSKPTLFNASKQTNFVYQIIPSLDKDKKLKVNNLETYGERIKWLKENNYKLVFQKADSPVFSSNMELIDSKLPEIMGHIILGSYMKKTNKINELVGGLTKENPCNFAVETNPNFYDYKVKRFLTDAALGMKAGKVWTGTFNANGGYIIVKKDGDLVCYHIYNWNDFQDYLLKNTKIDYPDSKPDRCDFGRILDCSEVNEKEGDYIKLNFQVRFL
ncbi:MAG: HpaII family restriction endonuclease [Capnocytophaga sp.]|nr:HpaII family restriction endonuclease [Capnocytophaga sp.]